MGNRIEWILSDLATTWLGAIFVGLNTWYREDDLAYVLNQSRASAVICSGDEEQGRYLGLVLSVRQRCPAITEVVVVGHHAADGDDRAGISFAELEASGGEEARPSSPIRPEDPANILYTSGTTATPKGVVLHHGKLIDNGFAIGERQHLDQNDVLWSAIPMFFSFFSANALMAVMTHFGSIVIQRRFSAGEALDLIERHRCTVYYGMPNMTQALLEEQARQPRVVSALRKGLTIGPSEMIRQTAALVPDICNVYGLTETYGNCAVCDASDDLDLKATTQGRLLPGFELKVVDGQTGRRLPVGEAGTLCIRGNVTSGYFNEPDLTREAFDHEGYFITGDYGLLDSAGRVHYLGRLKEIIKTGGINVSPEQVESVLLRHPGVRQAYVVGSPDPVKDEVPVAFIEPSPDSLLDLEELSSFARAALPSYAVPVHFRLIQDRELPRTATGKVQKSFLLAALWAGKQGP
jgi:fatty-acyl-CoA synthase